LIEAMIAALVDSCPAQEVGRRKEAQREAEAAKAEVLTLRSAAGARHRVPLRKRKRKDYVSNESTASIQFRRGASF